VKSLVHWRRQSETSVPVYKTALWILTAAKTYNISDKRNVFSNLGFLCVVSLSCCEGNAGFQELEVFASSGEQMEMWHCIFTKEAPHDLPSRKVTEGCGERSQLTFCRVCFGGVARWQGTCNYSWSAIPAEVNRNIIALVQTHFPIRMYTQGSRCHSLDFCDFNNSEIDLLHACEHARPCLIYSLFNDAVSSSE
jgi:hypothetical protein